MSPQQDRDSSLQEVDLGLTDALVQLSFLVQSILGRVASDHGLSIIQVRVLGVLRDRQPGMQQLARLLGLDKSSVSGLIDRAEEKGLVKRLAATDDRRAVRVIWTPKGRKIMADVERTVNQEISRLAQSLDGREQRELSRLASRLSFVESRKIDE
jgi:MarR family transcriptional regulator, lower aerobic nicotinate degradation pathway regulator